MTRAILYVLLLIMLCQDAVDSIDLNCSRNNSRYCQNTADRNNYGWTVKCPLPGGTELSAHIYDQSSLTEVNCHDVDTWPNVDISLYMNPGPEVTVRFIRCPRPGWLLFNVLEDFENETMIEFPISELTSTMSKLMRWNCSRLPRIQELSMIFDAVLEFSSDVLRDLSDLRKIWFWGNGISALPQGLFKGLTKLEELDLKRNKMQCVDSLLFENLSGLKLLILSYNRLESLDRGTFKNLLNLTELDISYNRLTTLPMDIFESLEKLEVLRMSGNEFSSLPLGLLVRNTRLITIKFSRNRGNLSTLPIKFFCDLISLREVDLSYNKFTYLPEKVFFVNPLVQWSDQSRYKWSELGENILRVNLAGNKLNNLPDDLFGGLYRSLDLDLEDNAITPSSRNLLPKSIRSVRLDYNHISEIESWTFSNSTMLTEVFLTSNKLSSLPENIFWGSFRLQILVISRNRLADLPAKLFRDSKNLRELNLDANNLTYFPEGIFRGLTNLLSLYLENNAFTTLPSAALAEATSLQRLYLDSNRMTEIDIRQLQCLHWIKYARFSHNLITRIIRMEYSLFETLGCHGNSDLIELHLDHNNITDFLWNETSIFGKLSYLDLSHNQISFLDLMSIDNMKSTVTVDVAYNNITKLAIDEIPEDLTIRLDIGDNPIDCGCDVYQLREHFVDRSRPNYRSDYLIMADNLECSQPDSMIGRLVEDLELETFECELNFSNKPRVCLEGCDCMWRPFDNTLMANCSYRNFTRSSFESSHFHGFKIELNLSGKSVTEMPVFYKDSGSDYDFYKITKIFLSRNRIRNFTFDSVPSNLAVLHLDNNHLTRLDVAVAEAVANRTSLQELALHSNPWNCHRETREAFNILKEKLDRNIGDAFNKTCLDFRTNKNGEDEPESYITYQIF